MKIITRLIKAITRSVSLKKVLSTLFVMGLLFISSIKVSAQSVTWTGEVDSVWHKNSNWSSSQTPDPGTTVYIRPQDGNPYPVISEDVTISTIIISERSEGGDLTVSNNGSLTITDDLTINNQGRLLIGAGGTVEITGNSFTMGHTDTFIEISSGTFISETNATINGTFNSINGSITFNNDLIVANHNSFNLGTSTVTVNGETTIKGTYNGDDGVTNFNSTARIESGGVMNLNAGEIYFNDGAFVGNNGTANLGSGTVTILGTTTVRSDGLFNVGNATVTISGDADFSSNGNMTIKNGAVNVQGNASLSSGGEFNLENGDFNVGGNASFTSGGTVNAGNSRMDFKGDLTVPYGGNFNSDSSTVTFSGDKEQIINTEGDDITFFDVNVTSGSSLQTDGSNENTVIIENDLTVEEGGQVGVKDNDTIDIQGNLNNRGDITSEKPFVYAISTPSLNEVLVTFDKEMDESTAEQVSNYSIDKGVSISNATLNSSDPTKLLLDVSLLTDDLEYELTINNVSSAAGGMISTNHIKRFTTIVDVTYYSRSSGNWNTPSSWSIESHTGAAASEIPNAQDGEDIIIGSNHTITVQSKQDVSNVHELTVTNSGILNVTAGGNLVLKELIVSGGGTFKLLNGGTISMGSPDGITAEGTDKGNIQTAYRSYSSAGNYIYNGTSAQQTGSGLPERVNDLSINNPSDVKALNNLRIDGSLYLQEGSLTIPSGLGLIANSQSIENGTLTFQRVLDGMPGWRMISSPVAANYGNFLDGVLQQGFSGSDYESLQPNIMHYDETYEGTDNQRWRAPSSSTDKVTAGLGYNLYIFGDISEDDRYNNPLPDTLSVEGQEHSGFEQQFDFNITYTAEADTGWNLVGNPFGASIDWDESGSWTKTNIDETIYVWDPDTHSYKTWNGTTGSLGSGIIPPFQAFWVKASEENTQLSVSKDAKTFGGEFVGKVVTDNHPEIEVELNHNGQSSSIFFNFSKDAKVGKDRFDGYYLEPPPDTRTYAQLFSIGRNKNRYSINSLPIEFGNPIEIPISANIVEEYQNKSEAVNLNIAGMGNIPYSWEITLVDRETGKELTPIQGLQYNFTTSAGPGPSTNDSTNVLKKDYQIISDASPEEARFALRIDPGALGLGLPKEIDLKQNYPNPFRSETNIRFTLPIQNEVTLEVYDILGRKVATLADNESFQAGLHNITWGASGIANGTYIYRLVTKDRTISKKLTAIGY